MCLVMSWLYLIKMLFYFFCMFNLYFFFFQNNYINNTAKKFYIANILFFLVKYFSCISFFWIFLK